MSKNHHPDIRRPLATNPNTPTYILELLARAGYKKEVASNPNAPAALRKKTLEDEDFALKYAQCPKIPILEDKLF